MTIVRWDPFRDFGFTTGNTWVPPVDIYQTGEHELAMCGGRSRVREMVLPERRAFLRVVVDDVVKEKVVHVYRREALG